MPVDNIKTSDMLNTSGTKDRFRLVIVGGVAGGASCAARARRLSEKAEIAIFERGPYISFANCGLPYFVGNIIPDEQNLIVATPELFRDRFHIQVCAGCNVTAIDRTRNEIQVAESATGAAYNVGYDALVLAPGAAPIRPPLPGIDLPGIYSLRSIPDSRQIRDWLAAGAVKKAVIVGGGAIGLEMTENLVKRGVAVEIIEMMSHVMPSLDAEMAQPIHDHLTAQGVNLHLGDGVAGFERADDGTLRVITASGQALAADMVVLSIGVRPEVDLARRAGLEIGDRHGIRVDDQMRTSDPCIWAVGDAVEVRDIITGEWITAALAGPANRQGRVAADSIFGRDSRFRGVQGTAICGVLGLTIAATGATENILRRHQAAGTPPTWDKVYLFPEHHASFYPGASAIVLKLIFARDDGRVLGAQAVGEQGVDKRIDVIALAIQNRATVFDLEAAELCYAPQYGSAKDPVNLAGMVAANALRGDAPVAHWEEVPQTTALILDVRDTGEHNLRSVAGAVNIPLNELRARLHELPRDREIWAFCSVGRRSYLATRILRLNGFNARNLSGGMRTYRNFKQIGLI
jgi:NADPH-dependent 2,4-dienoyl-CoA reductase/sulfur reductase-like enzyme/rhodanese-related sulfurtransferase